MSEYTSKNYTEQGGDVTHIGGKLVIDDGADISGLVAAIQNAGKASVCDLKSSYLGKNYSDMVDEDVKILTGGVVTGHIKYLSGYEAAFPSRPEGHFFPVSIGKEYEGKKIVCKRESGEGGTEKTSEDLDWVLFLTDGGDSVFSFKTEDGEPIVTLSFNKAVLVPKED